MFISFTKKLWLSPISKQLAVRTRFYCTHSNAMDLKQVVAHLENFSPKSLSESWDNVGLLVEPSSPHSVERMFLCNDLTEPVLKEAIDEKCDMILCYHPVIFSPIKRLTQSSWKERIITRCLENRIAVYCPHTCFDTMRDGINDWLISPFEGDVQPISKLKKQNNNKAQQCKIECFIWEKAHLQNVQENLAIQIAKMSGEEQYYFITINPDHHLLVINCAENKVTEMLSVLKELEDITGNICPQVFRNWEPTLPEVDQGAGRICKLQTPINIEAAVKKVKDHLGLPHIRLACPLTEDGKEKMIQSVAVCAGSGSGVLAGVKADLYITGEMSHHAVLDACQNGTFVILCEHSNSERGFLQLLKESLARELSNVKFVISSEDCDPLKVI